MQSRNDFDEKREMSKVYEIAFSNWLQRRGYYILPTYDYSGLQDNKAPKLACGNKWLVIPDLYGAIQQGTRWFEIKLKDSAVLHRKTNTIVTGFSLKHWRDYQEVKRVTGNDVFIVFIHQQENEVRTGELDELPISHIYEGNKMGKHGMVFFCYEKLKCIMKASSLNAFKLP